MCIKLIDVLSSHTSLIKMRIDTDLITYMCSIILPKQVFDKTLGNTFQPKSQLQDTHSRMISMGIGDLEGTMGKPSMASHHYQMMEEEDNTQSQYRDQTEF